MVSISSTLTGSLVRALFFLSLAFDEDLESEDFAGPAPAGASVGANVVWPFCVVIPDKLAFWIS